MYAKLPNTENITFSYEQLYSSSEMNITAIDEHLLRLVDNTCNCTLLSFVLSAWLSTIKE